MWKVELALTRILGVKPAWMRPPYGNYNDLVRQASLIRNQSLVIWDFDDGDSVGATVAQSEQDYTDLANRHPNNVLALNHETYKTTAYVLPEPDLNTEYASANVFPMGSEQVLPFAIQKLKAKGYTFKTVAECLGMPAYASVGTPGTKDVSSSSLSIYQSLGADIVPFRAPGRANLLSRRTFLRTSRTLLCRSSLKTLSDNPISIHVLHSIFQGSHEQ